MNPAGSAVTAFLQNLEPGREMQVAVIDRSGVVIAAADPQQLFRTLAHAAEYGERIGAHRPLVSETFSGEFASARGAGADMLTVMVPLRFAPWGVVLQQSRARAFAGVRTTRRGLVAAGVMLAVVGVLLARALSRSVVAPIQALSAQAEAIRAGIEGVGRRMGYAMGLVTASIGVTEYDVRRPPAEDLLVVADRALYQAKAAGRNVIA